MKIKSIDDIFLLDFQNYTHEFLKQRAKQRISKEIFDKITANMQLEMYTLKDRTRFQSEVHFFSKTQFKAIASTITELNEAIERGKDTKDILKSLCDLLRL